jgi:predicted TIM-barrel fold metal-dependent hydrolase
MRETYEICSSLGKPLVMHVGREPRNPHYGYPIDPYETCRADKLEEVLKSYPRLKICVPHLGANEYADYKRMVEQYDNLWLDTAMVLADHLPGNDPPELPAMRGDRIMYGTDFPNIPYAWDRELVRLGRPGLPAESFQRILGRNAVEFFGISR